MANPYTTQSTTLIGQFVELAWVTKEMQENEVSNPENARYITAFRVDTTNNTVTINATIPVMEFHGNDSLMFTPEDTLVDDASS